MRDIPFLQEDVRDDAEILQMKAAAYRQFVEAGVTPDAARAVVVTGDLARLDHSGLVSVQLQPIGAAAPLSSAD